VRADVGDQALEEALVDPLADDVLVRPLGHRLGERPVLLVDEGTQVGREGHEITPEVGFRLASS
jgi:hypothetical protein